MCLCRQCSCPECRVFGVRVRNRLRSMHVRRMNNQVARNATVGRTHTYVCMRTKTQKHEGGLEAGEATKAIERKTPTAKIVKNSFALDTLDGELALTQTD